MDSIADMTASQAILGAALLFYVSIGALLIRQHCKIENARKARKAAQ